MSEMTPEGAQTAKEAIMHVLNAIADDPRKYWLMGRLTGSYEKLTRAAAEILGKPIKEVQSHFQPEVEEYEKYIAKREEEAQILDFCNENGLTSQNIKERLRS